MDYQQFYFSFSHGYAWLYILLCVLALGLSVVTYNNTIPMISSTRRNVLICIRTLALSLLLILLFEPLLRFIESSTTKPKVAVLIDNSRSMHMKDRSGNRGDVVNPLLKNVVDKLGTNAHYFQFGESVALLQNAKIDSLKFADERTDIAGALQWVSNISQTDGYSTVLLISDGNYNTGENPIQLAEQTGLGVYSIGVGDTIAPSDVKVDALITNPIQVVGQATEVTAQLSYSFDKEQIITVVLEDNGKEVSRVQRNVLKGESSIRVELPWTPQTEGIRDVHTRVMSVAGEFTTANNYAQQFVRVQKNKRKIVIIAGAPSPDVAFVTEALRAIPQVEVVSFVQKQGATFYTSPPTQADFVDAQTCILIGFPIASSPTTILQQVATAANNGCSVLFIASSQTDYTKLKPLSGILPFSVEASRAQEMQVSADVSRGMVSDPLLKISGAESDQSLWNGLPPIYRTETFVQLAPGASVLATIKVGNTPLEEPLLVKRELGTSRSLALLGYGIYRWKLLANGPAASRGEKPLDVFSAFLGNSVQWLSVPKNNKPVTITASQDRYAPGERVFINAAVADASQQPVEDATVEVTMKGASVERIVVLERLGGGRYSIDVGALPEGDYTFSGTAKKGSLSLGSDNGRFTVGKLGLEDKATTMNSSLLRALATQTNALYGASGNTDKVIEALLRDARMKEIAQTKERELALWHLPWVLAVVILLFATEWFLRKRSSLV